MLRVEPGELDLHAFEQRVADGRHALEHGDPGQAAVLLRAAESLWRGRPLADLEFEPFARFEVQRLEASRLAAVEDRIEAELALGRDRTLCPELEQLVAEHPLRERLRGQLMLALYRTGRQAEALEAYRAGRLLLAEEWRSSRARSSNSFSSRSSNKTRPWTSRSPLRGTARRRRQPAERTRLPPVGLPPRRRHLPCAAAPGGLRWRLVPASSSPRSRSRR